MTAVLKQLKIQCKCDLRNRSVLLVTFIIPFVYYILIGYLAKSIGAENGIIWQTMILTISLTAYSLLPQKFVTLRKDGVLNTYRVSGIPFWSYYLNSIILGFLFNVIFFIAIMFLTPILYRAILPSNVFLFLIVIMACAISSMSLGLFFSCFIKKTQVVGILTVLLFLPSVIELSILPTPIKMIVTFLPANLSRLAIGGNLLGPMLIMGAETLIYSCAASWLMSLRIKNK